MSRADVKATIGADTSELRAALDESGEMLHDAERSFHTAGRASHIFSEGLEAIGVESGIAGTAVSKLLGGFATGGPIGLAIGAVEALVSTLHTLHDEATKEPDDKALKAIEKDADSAAASVAAATYELEKAQFVADKKGSGADFDAMKAAEGFIGKRKELLAELAAVEKQLDDAKVARAKVVNAVDEQHTGAIDKQITALNESKTQILEGLAEIHAGEDTLRKNAERKDQEAADKELDTAKKAEQRKAEAVEKAKEESDARIQEQRVKDAEKEEAQKNAQKGMAVHAVYEIEQAKLEEKEKFEKQDALQEARIEAQKEKQLEQQAKRADQILKKRYAQELKDVQEAQRQWQQAAHTVASSFESMVFSGESASKAIKGLFVSLAEQMINYFVEMAIEKIMADKVAAAADRLASVGSVTRSGARAGAEVAANLASNPVTMAGAIPAGEAFAAAVVGAFGPDASAAGGWEVPWSASSSGVPTLVHPDEKVLPADKSAAMDRMLAGGGQGATHHHTYVFNAIDGPSIRRLVRSNEWRKAIADAARDGVN